MLDSIQRMLPEEPIKSAINATADSFTLGTREGYSEEYSDEFLRQVKERTPEVHCL